MGDEQFYSILPSIILGLAGIIVTVIFSRSARKRENDKIMKELFKDFNERYNEINNDLIRIMEPQDASAKASLHYTWVNDRATLIDYLNLCAEEYFWYKKGRIDEKVWRSWSIGMNYWYNHKSSQLRDLWEAETKKKNGPQSYYLQTGDEFFKK